jgi:hypothetical protein
MKTEKEISKVTILCLKFLKEDERCRNDDKWLTYKVFREFTNIYIPFEDFKKLPAFETVKRCRAKIQNVEHKFMPTSEEVRKKRRMREEDFKKWSVK